MAKNYLVVDDCSINRMVIKIILKKNVCNVSEVNNGQSVIDLIKNGNTFDIIWIDLQMPDMDGIECTKILREEYNYKNHIVGISAYADDETKEECIKSGMDYMIPKPINEHQINKIISKCLDY